MADIQSNWLHTTEGIEESTQNESILMNNTNLLVCNVIRYYLQAISRGPAE